MADHDSVIDALLAYLDGSLSADDRWAPAIRALVEDRNELTLMHAHLGQSYTMLAKECDALKQRVAVLESQEFTLPTDPFRDPDRELRERLIESALRAAGIGVVSLVREVDRLSAELAAAKKRIEELEAQPPASDRDKAMERWMDQVTAMLCHSMTHSHDAKQELATRCDAAIAAMREGVSDGK